MTVYLLHLDRPMSHAQHYLGYTDDLVGRILQHGDTTWEPLDKPVTLEDGRPCTGVKHGPGSTFMGVVNSRGIGYQLARVWDGPEADRTFERYLKSRKESPRFCPVCNPETALNWAKIEGYSRSGYPPA